MNRTLLVFLVGLAVIAGSLGQQCGVNEEFKSCGSACEPTCGLPAARVCTFECRIGCQCRDGYMRNQEGACVLPENC